jgi:hypothetical protein
METSSRRRTETAAVGLASTMLVGFAAYGLLVILELFLAQHATSPESLPPPGDRRMLLALIVVAGISGVLIALWWRRDNPAGSNSVRGLFAFTAIATAAVVVATLVTHSALEKSYLHSVPAGTASNSALLQAGHKACDWLGGRHWGRPSGPYEQGYLEGVPYIGHPTLNIINSTGRLATEYHHYVSTQPPNAMTRLEDKVSLLAWYKMCPLQQWVHRPVGGSGD